jgi:hypothetical protein
LEGSDCFLDLGKLWEFGSILIKILFLLVNRFLLLSKLNESLLYSGNLLALVFGILSDSMDVFVALDFFEGLFKLLHEDSGLIKQFLFNVSLAHFEFTCLLLDHTSNCVD